MLQCVKCVAVCCSVLQCVAVCCSDSVSPRAFRLYFAAVCRSVLLQCAVAVWCSVLHRVAVSCSEQFSASPSAFTQHYVAVYCTESSFQHRRLHSYNTMLQGVAGCCTFSCALALLPYLYVAACCSVLQYVSRSLALVHVGREILVTLCCSVLQRVAAYCNMLHLFLRSCASALALSSSAF